MKVCTDSCLFGAWATKKMVEHFPESKNVLDIGTGTGLLSLMIAQQHHAEIHALDVEEGAIRDARLNFAHSPWHKRLHLHHTAIQEYAKENQGRFDLVICNPPFFLSSLRSTEKGKNISKHEENLPLKELVGNIKTVLKDEGAGFILLPVSRREEFEKILVDENMNWQERMEMTQSMDHDVFRVCYMFGRYRLTLNPISQISIRDTSGNYTAEFMALLKPYYLKL